METHVDGFNRAGYIPWTKTFGDGRLVMFRNGKVFEGIWRRDKGENLKFFDSDGNVLPVKKGQVWVTMLPTLNMVSWE